MRRPDGVTLLAIYQLVLAVPLLIGACAISVFAIFPTVSNTRPEELPFALFGLVIGLFFTLGGAVLSVIAGWGLLAMKEWARWLTIALAILSLPLFPIGTIIGALIIWYLFQDEVKVAFEASTAALSAPGVEPAIEPVEEADSEEG